MTDDAAAEVRHAELERCRITSERNWEALSAVLADDLTYTHMQGDVDDKQMYLDGLQRRPRTVKRGDFDIRVYGDIAVTNGRQYLDAGNGEVESEALQVWHRADDDWKLVACQSGRVGELT